MTDEETVTPIAHLTALADELFDLEAKVTELQDDLKTAQRRVQTLTEHDIPEAMDTAGVETITLKTGLSVVVTDDVKAGDLKRADGLEWLRKNGEGGCIKTAVTVPFATGSDADADEFLERLAGEGLLATKAASVHNQTLKSIIRKLLAEGVDVPMKDLGAFPLRKAKVTAKKGKS